MVNVCVRGRQIFSTLAELSCARAYDAHTLLNGTRLAIDDGELAASRGCEANAFRIGDACEGCPDKSKTIIAIYGRPREVDRLYSFV